MTKTILTHSLTAFVAVAGLSIAAPAAAQIGGITGSVGGTIDNTTRSTTDLRANTRTRVSPPKPNTSVKVRSTRSGGYHTHDSYSHHTHTPGRNGFADSHYHGHGDNHGHVYVHGEFSNKPKDKKDTKKSAEAKAATKTELLTFGTVVYSDTGAELGPITSLQRMSDGEIVGITIANKTALIPIGDLTLINGTLVHSLPPVETTE